MNTQRALRLAGGMSPEAIENSPVTLHAQLARHFPKGNLPTNPFRVGENAA